MSRKDYKQGMADAMTAYEDFGKKQERAIRHVEGQIEKASQKIDGLGSQINAMNEYIIDSERAKLYKLNTPIDIADLTDMEKRVLLAVLYQLIDNADEVTPEQQNYVLAVQHYLKVYNPQTEIDLSAIENLEDISAQKAILQTVLEFFYLGTDPGEFTEEQEEVLDYFQVNRKTHREILDYVETIIDAVGLKGLAEKYGVAENQPRSEFAIYNDNGPIPEKVADLCLTYIKNGCSQFQNGEYILETKDYLVMYGKSAIHSQEDSEIKENGFFCVEKRSGKVARIAIDYKKDFPFIAVSRLSFCVQGNTVYFIENCVNRGKYPEVHLVSIDFAKKEFQKHPFKFSISTYTPPVRFHISCSNAYVMVYVYYIYNDVYARNIQPLSKVFVMDIAHGNRIFTLEPDLIVRDALIYDNQFLLLGKTMGAEGITSLFRYDVKEKVVTDVLEKYTDWLGGVMRWLASVSDDWVDRYRENFIIEAIRQIDDIWYFQYRNEEEYSAERHLQYTCIEKEIGHPCLMHAHMFLPETTPILMIENAAITWDRFKDEPKKHLKRYDFLTRKTTFLDKGADDYILLGDYLYKRVNTEWYKTNISQGLDRLQWELMCF